jgi:hypothetical protein
MIHRIRDSQMANLTCPTDVFRITSARRALTVGDPDYKAQVPKRAKGKKTGNDDAKTRQRESIE